VRAFKIRVVRSLFGDVGVRAFKIRVVRSLFGDVGVRSFKIEVVVCDRCLGMLGCDLLKLRWLCAIAV